MDLFTDGLRSCHLKLTTPEPTEPSVFTEQSGSLNVFSTVGGKTRLDLVRNIAELDFIGNLVKYFQQ